MNTILIIEDDLQIRRMIRDFLEHEKYTCIIAENGKEGLDLSKKVLPDLIISDVMMPEMDGYLLKKELSQNPLTALIPFIFLTSMDNRDSIRKGMELGADDYLFKPFKFLELKNSIEVQLEKRKSLIKEFYKSEPAKNVTKLENNEFFLIKDKGNPRFIKILDIIAVLADEKYTKVVLSNRDKIIASKSLAEWEEFLPEANFIRIHRSTLINISCVEKIEKWFNRSYKLKLKGFDEPVFISKRFYSKIKELFL